MKFTPKHASLKTVAKIIVCERGEYMGNKMGRIINCGSMVEAFQAQEYLVGKEDVEDYSVVKL